MRTYCPGCEAAFKIPDELVGHLIRCKSCQSVFSVRSEPVWPPPHRQREEPPAPVPEVTDAESPSVEPPIG
jgi:predicted Zn finger-like uncharacterized protein